MVRHRLLRALLILGGLFFVAGIYPLFTSIPQHQQSDYGDQMMLAVYWGDVEVVDIGVGRRSGVPHVVLLSTYAA